MTLDKTIVFKKAILDKLNHEDGEWRYAKNIEGLCIRLFKNKIEEAIYNLKKGKSVMSETRKKRGKIQGLKFSE